MNYELSCGAVLYRNINGKYEYLIVKDRNNNYSFPKGHMEKGETIGECAKREVKEEVGLDIDLDKMFCYDISYPISNEITKCVSYFMADFKNENPFINDNEIKEIEILNYEEAYNALTFKQHKDLLEEVNYRLVDNMKTCCMFSLKDPEEANLAAIKNLRVVEEYGSSLRVHTCDSGERWLSKCEKCGAYVLVQQSETWFTDHDYYDYIPVGSIEHARYVNNKYDGYSIETNYPYKKLFINDGKAVWH